VRFHFHFPHIPFRTRLRLYDRSISIWILTHIQLPCTRNKQETPGSHGIREHILYSLVRHRAESYIFLNILRSKDFGRIMAKDLTYEKLTPGLETRILGLGHYQQEISDRESTIMPYIDFFYSGRIRDYTLGPNSY
jgi:hypothetical protein